MVRYDYLGQDTLISYRIQAPKKTGLIVGRSGSRGPLDHSRKWFHWNVSAVALLRPIRVPGLIHSYLGMVWCAVYFGHQPCGISRTNCLGHPWKNRCWIPPKASILALLMFVGTIYLPAVTLWSSFTHSGRWAHLAAFQPSRPRLDHTPKWFHRIFSLRRIRT